MDRFDLNGQVALVAGGAGGIGQAVVLGLAAHGADVAVADLAAAPAESVVERVKARGRRGLALQADITNATSAERMIAQTVDGLGKLDVFVNTVGMNIFGNAFDLSDDDWQRVLNVNLSGAFFASRAAARRMAQNGGGRIVNFASVTALRGSPGQAAYAAAKAAVVSLTKSMALEWAQHGIRVNAVSPVMTETPINADWLAAEPHRKAAIAERIPAGRLGKPEDFAGPVIFLTSEASSFVYGQTLFVDGGASVTHPLFGA